MFDKIKFAKILSDINNSYDTMTEFAQKSGVNRTYLSQYINQKLDAPPSPKVLMKIARNSKGITTYDSLMNICGFLTYNRDFSKTENAESILTYNNLVRNISLNEKEKQYLNLLFLEYNELRKNKVSIEEIRKQLLNKIKLLPLEKYNIDNMKKALEMYILSVSAQNIVEYIYETSAELDAKNNYLDSIDKLQSLCLDIPDIPDIIKASINTKFFNCPVYGKISAGQPNWAEECIEGYLPIDPNMMNITNPEECFFLRVDGQSMNEVVKNGGYALIRKQNYAEDGDIVVAIVNGNNEATLKRFKKFNEQFVSFEPMSSDESIKPINVDLKETNVIILGKYIGKFEMN